MAATQIGSAAGEDRTSPALSLNAMLTAAEAEPLPGRAVPASVNPGQEDSTNELKLPSLRQKAGFLPLRGDQQRPLLPHGRGLPDLLHAGELGSSRRTEPTHQGSSRRPGTTLTTEFVLDQAVEDFLLACRA